MREKIKAVYNYIFSKLNNFGKMETFIFILYIILSSIVSLHHEFFQDETQSFLIARDLNLIDIIAQMKYEGHSFFWYYLIAPLAKLGFSIEFQKVLPLFFSIFTVYIILKKAPFHIITKMLLIFNPATLYYNLFARPYCMIPFFLVCIACIYKDRKLHPYKYALYIGLLAHTHLIMLPTCILLIVLFWGKELIINSKKNTSEEIKRLRNSLILVTFMVSIFILIIIMGYINCMIIEIEKENNIGIDYLSLIINTFLYQNIHLFGLNHKVYYYFGYEPFTYFNILVIVVLLLCLLGIKNSKKQGIIFWCQYLFTLCLHSFFWFPLQSRSFIIIYTLMFWVWTYRYDKPKSKKIKRNIFVEAAFVLLLTISLPGSYNIIYQDLTKSYCSGKDTASFIENSIPKGSIIINLTNDWSQLLAGYLKKDQYKFYVANAKRYITYNIWDDRYKRRNTVNSAKKTIVDVHNDNKNSNIYVLEPNIYNVSMVYINMNEIYKTSDFSLKEIYASDKSEMIDDIRVYDNIAFRIYKVSFE